MEASTTVVIFGAILIGLLGVLDWYVWTPRTVRRAGPRVATGDRIGEALEKFASRLFTVKYPIFPGDISKYAHRTAAHGSDNDGGFKRVA